GRPGRAVVGRSRDRQVTPGTAAARKTIVAAEPADADSHAVLAVSHDDAFASGFSSARICRRLLAEGHLRHKARQARSSAAAGGRGGGGGHGFAGAVAIAADKRALRSDRAGGGAAQGAGIAVSR